MSNAEIDDLVKQEELDRKRKKLFAAVKEDADVAFDSLKKEPINVLLLRSVCRELRKRNDSNSQKFLDRIETEVKRVLSPDKLVDNFGNALALEFLVENWRRKFAENKLSSVEEVLVSMGNTIYQSLDEDDESLDNKVTIAIAKEFQNRIKQLASHEEKLFLSGWESCKEDIKSLIDDAIKDGVSKKLDLFLSLGVLSSVNAVTLKRNMAQVVFKKLKDAFPKFSEDEKYRLAPWLTALKLNAMTEEEQEKELADKLEGSEENQKTMIKETTKPTKKKKERKRS